jgi:hypothetical protein
MNTDEYNEQAYWNRLQQVYDDLNRKANKTRLERDTMYDIEDLLKSYGQFKPHTDRIQD